MIPVTKTFKQDAEKSRVWQQTQINIYHNWSKKSFPLPILADRPPVT